MLFIFTHFIIFIMIYRVIPDEVHFPESSESNPCFFFLLSEHRPACRFPSWPQSNRKKMDNSTKYKQI